MNTVGYYGLSNGSSIMLILRLGGPRSKPKGNEYKYVLDYEGEYKKNDIFMLSIDWKNNMVSIYHNGSKMDDVISMDSDTESIIPAISLEKDVEIEILKCISE